MKSNTRAVVFDMDDTLYFERDYVRSGFQAVAQHIGAPDRAFGLMWGWFEDGHRGDTFDRILDIESPWRSQHRVADLVEVYRTHRPNIQLSAAVEKTLRCLRERGVKTGVITDGAKSSQQAKVDALGLTDLVDAVLITDSLGRAHWKPAESGYRWMEDALNRHPDQLVYIGDNPQKDFIAPNHRGWTTVRLRMPLQLRHALESPSVQAAAETELRSWEALTNWLTQWLGDE